MLSTCWFTTPFTGCFSSNAKGGVGSGMQEGGDGDQRVRVSQPPPQSTKNQVSVNGVAGGASGATGGSAATACDPQPATDQQLPRTPRKSKSMGRIHGGGAGPEVGEGAAGGPETGGVTQQQGSNQEGQYDQAPSNPDAAAPTQHWHRGHRRTPSDGVAWRHSKGLEADRIIGGETMLGSGEDEKLYKRAYKSEYRKKFRPFSQYQYVDGKFHKVKTDENTGGGSESPNNWYKEVIELRRQAGQYRYRGWGVETATESLAEIYSKQAELWEQVSRRSSLQALSLASASPRPISKAEKEIENSRRSSPIKHVSKTSRERPSTAPPKPKPAAVHSQKPSDKTDGKTSKESTPRHHYERTTGTAEEGLLITSPSRDKLEPFIPDDLSSRRSSRRTPPITSPMKDGPSRRRSYRASSAARPPLTKDSRSSVGGRSVSVGPENRSPKRTSRPPSTHATAPTTKSERRPRPSEETDSKKDKEKEILPKDGPKDILKDSTPKDSTKEPVEAVKESSVRKSTPEPRFDPEKYEPVVKTPPEPTRVKSPDQVMVKSPDPVNWTVPLDTGKTFTVTQNIPEGESARGTPSSEYRHVLESRTRQTPEPTKLSQGSLAGTPVSSIASEAKSYSQEQPKPTTATTVDPKVDDKCIEKKIEPKPESQESKISEKKIPEGKPLNVDDVTTELDVKAYETKSKEVKSDQKISESKEEPKLSDIKSETKPLEAKVKETNSFESKVPETKPYESKVPETKPVEFKVPETKPVESIVSEIIPLESKGPDTKPREPLAPEPKVNPVISSEPFGTEVKAPEPKKPEPSAELRKSEPDSEPKLFQPQPLLQQQQAPSSPPARTQASPMDIVPPSGAVDPMTMSMFGSLNGMNGKSSGTPSPTKPEVPLPSSEPVKDVSTSESKPVSGRNVPGTNLRCLDDPSFMFDQPSAPTNNSPKSGAFKVLEVPEHQQPKSGGFRVLEAPEAPSDIKDLPDQSPTKPEAPVKPSPYRVLEAPIDPPSRPKGSPYRVLEAPDAPYYPQTQSIGAAHESKPPSLVSPSSGRTVTDALDKARTRFDSFWGGSKDKDPPSKV